MAPTVKTLLPPTRSGRTLAIALSLLGAVAVVQLLILGGFLIGGGIPSHRPAGSTSNPPPSQISDLPQGQVATVVHPIVSPTLALPTPAPVASVEPPAPAIARPTPAPAPRLQNTFTDLLEQARQLRARGDMNSALARLREAQVAEPDNAQIIAEMAATYEAMQIPDRAFEQWQRLYKLGDSAGVLYDLAKFKLQNVPSAPAAPNAAGAPTATDVQDANAFAQGDAVLKLTDIHTEKLEDPAAEQKVSLRIVVKNRPGTAIDPTKVRILTYFYDLVDGQDEVLTDALTAFAWLTPGRVDWANDKSEVLETTYTRPKVAPTPEPTPTPENTPAKKGKRGKSAAAAPAAATPTPTPKPPQVRTYLGYSVRLYYNGQLQDVQTDPVRLLQKFPPPMTLSAD